MSLNGIKIHHHFSSRRYESSDNQFRFNSRTCNNSYHIAYQRNYTNTFRCQFSTLFWTNTYTVEIRLDDVMVHFLKVQFKYITTTTTTEKLVVVKRDRLIHKPI